MSFSLDNKLVFIDSFQIFFNFSSSVKNFGGNDFKHLSQEFDREVLRFGQTK